MGHQPITKRIGSGNFFLVGWCPVWMSHVTYESCHIWVMAYMNESCHIWTSQVTYEWVMSHMKKTCHVWTSHVTHVNESCHIWISHVAYKRVKVLPVGHAPHKADPDLLVQVFIGQIRHPVCQGDSKRCWLALRVRQCECAQKGYSLIQPPPTPLPPITREHVNTRVDTRQHMWQHLVGSFKI